MEITVLLQTANSTGERSVLPSRVESADLIELYQIGKGTVLRLLREHGAGMGRQGLTRPEIKEAVDR